MRHRLHTRTATELIALALAVLVLAPASSSHASAAVAGEPGFSLSCDPSRLSVQQGESGLTRCTVASANGFEGPVHLSCATPAPGLSCRFAPNPVAPVSDGTAESVLTIEVSPDVGPGDYTLQARGTNGSNTAASDIDLVIHGPSPDFNLICTPNAFTIKQGFGASATCGAYSYNGFSGPVSLSCAGQPVGVVCSFNPPTTFYASDLLVTVACGVATGGWTFQVVGTSGALTNVTPIKLGVIPWRECSG
jgi:hypothetical protein